MICMFCKKESQGWVADLYVCNICSNQKTITSDKTIVDKSSFVKVERKDLEELKRKSQWTPASKENEMFDACFIFCEKYLGKGG